MRCGSTARPRRCRSMASSRSIRRCRTCTGSIRPARPPSCTRPRRPIGSARISTARTCWRAGCPSPAPSIPAGSTARWRGSSRSRPVRRSTDPRGRRAFAVGPVTPLVVRGPAPVLSWTPPRLQPVSEETTMRLLELYRHTDPTFARALEDRLGLTAIARAGGISEAPDPKLPAVAGRRHRAGAGLFRRDRRGGGEVPRAPEGPRIGALALDGWDTHVNEGAVSGRLASLLGALDSAIAAIKTNMGEAWGETVVTLITEFGRTARVNGNEGTDHGTGTVALLAGGALKGGRVIADWPGLKESRSLREARPQGHHRPARRAQGRAQGPPAPRRPHARRRGISGQRGGGADGGAAGLSIIHDLRCAHGVVPAKTGTHTLCPIQRTRRMGPGSVSAFTRVFDTLRAGTTGRVRRRQGVRPWP